MAFAMLVFNCRLRVFRCLGLTSKTAADRQGERPFRKRALFLASPRDWKGKEMEKAPVETSFAKEEKSAGKESVLIVDDSNVNIMVLAEALRPDYETRFAKSGPEAIGQACSSSPPDIILLDIQMPGMDGYETCERLKNDPRSKNIPVIFVTAKFKGDDDEKKGLEMGAVDYITKPVNTSIVKTRVRTQLELKRHRRQLEDLVAERTRELIEANACLKNEIEEKIKAKKESEELQSQLFQASKLEAIGTLAGGIAHDFNNMVGSILLNAELAMDDVSADSEARYSMDQIVKVGKRARKLIEQILIFSRKSNERLEPEDIRLPVQESLEMLRRLMPEKISLEERIAGEPCLVMANATQIHQLVVNLGVNAIHAMKDGHGKIRVTLQRSGKSHGCQEEGATDASGGVLLAVADEGCGIKKADLDRIFDPFFTTKPPGEGSGLGLSAVHGIVASHDGKMTVHSEPGKGTCFQVLFPEIDTAPEQAGIAESVASFETVSEKILLVDDEQDFAEANRRVLVKMGYDVVAETSVADALELFRLGADLFDLAILDMFMPDMNGLELAEELHRIKPGMPIIISSGFTQAIDPKKMRSIGIADIVTKPFSRATIAQSVRLALGSMR